MWTQTENQTIFETLNLPLPTILKFFPTKTRTQIKARRSQIIRASKWTTEEEIFLKNNYQTQTDEKLSKQLQKTTVDIIFKRQQFNFQRLRGGNTHHRWTNKDKSDFFEMYATTSMDSLLQRFPWSSFHGLHEMARRGGLKRKVEYRKGTVQPLLENTPLTYYWIGFAMADGWISENGHFIVTVNKKDREHLQKLATFLNTNIGNMQHNMLRIAIMDHTLVPQIKKKFDFKFQKTYNPPNLSYLNNKNKFLAFLAGFIDGDGSITKKGNLLRIQIHQNWFDTLIKIEKQLFFLMNYTTQLIHTKKITRKTHSGYLGSNQTSAILAISDSKFLKSLKHELLALNLPILHRKWDCIQL